MAKVTAKHTLDETLDMIHTHLTELRQTEALEAQIHDMVVAKRHRLDGLMSEFLRLASEPVGVAVAPEVAVAPQAVAPQVVAPQVVAPVVVEVPDIAPETPLAAATLPLTTLPLTNLPLTTLPPIGAPRDLLQTNGNGRSPVHGSNAAAPTPSAQQVLDSLNRLMSGLKEISVKQGNAPPA